MSLFSRKVSHALPAPNVLLKGAPEKDEIRSIDIPEPNPIVDVLMLDPWTLVPMNETSSEHQDGHLTFDALALASESSGPRLCSRPRTSSLAEAVRRWVVNYLRFDVCLGHPATATPSAPERMQSAADGRSTWSLKILRAISSLDTKNWEFKEKEKRWTLNSMLSPLGGACRSCKNLFEWDW